MAHVKTTQRIIDDIEEHFWKQPEAVDRELVPILPPTQNILDILYDKREDILVPIETENNITSWTLRPDLRQAWLDKINSGDRRSTAHRWPTAAAAN